jgi:hypothetical protein
MNKIVVLHAAGFGAAAVFITSALGATTSLSDSVTSGSIDVSASSVVCTFSPSLNCATLSDEKTTPLTGAGAASGNASQPLVVNNYGQSASPASSSSASVTVSTKPAGALTASASGWTAPLNGTGAYFDVQPTLTYTLEVLGPSGFVPLTVDTSGWVQVNSAAAGAFTNNLVSASFVVGPNLISDEAYLNAYGGNYSGPTSKSFNDQNTYDEAILANQSYSVTLSLFLQSEVAGNLGGGLESLSAYVDPIFSVPDGYTLVLSPDVGNGATAAPEASTWAMLLLGFCGLGWAAHVRRLARARDGCSARGTISRF